MPSKVDSLPRIAENVEKNNVFLDRRMFLTKQVLGISSQVVARVLELVDKLDSGSSARKGVRVRIPPLAWFSPQQT